MYNNVAPVDKPKTTKIVPTHFPKKNPPNKKKRAKIFNDSNLNSSGDIIIFFLNIVSNFYSENLYPPP